MKNIDDIPAYKTASELSNYIWTIVKNWSIFEQKTVGEQFVKAIDSTSANIAEGEGRYFKKDKIRFYQFALGSTFESADWCKKSFRRKIVTEKQSEHILSELRKLQGEIKYLVTTVKKNLEH